MNQTEAVNQRRTFAIISHPDAGKTTLTEKLLLYGGAIHLAGSVKARKANRHATSDWMEIEKQRGISVTSSVMQFQYNGYCINILDTPGHQDFSEDTYRTLCAADAAVMLIDGAKGVEPQTIKLFQVCRKRGIPIFTFVNKMDRAARPPFELMDELEQVLGIFSYPINWPIGTDGNFQGVYNRLTRQVQFFDQSSSDHGSSKVRQIDADLEDPALEAQLGNAALSQLKEEIDLLEIAGDPLDLDRVRQGQLTPLFFGSAITNFGIEPFLQEFLRMAPPPGPHTALEGEIASTDPQFTAFVFKIQANMNPDHRDRMAFLRICSGVYTREADVKLARTGKKTRLTAPQQMMADERQAVEEAYAGDIIGVFDPGQFRIGDTVYSGNRTVTFQGIPVFPPEFFARITPKDSMKRKQFLKGMQELSQEGAVQLYKQPDIGTETYIAGVVGMLQFDVLLHRLKNEYGVEIRMENLPYRYARWVVRTDGGPVPAYDSINKTSTTLPVLDRDGALVFLFESPWAMDWIAQKNEGLALEDIHA